MFLKEKKMKLENNFGGFTAKFDCEPAPDFVMCWCQRGDRVGTLKIKGNGVNFSNKYNMDYHLVFFNIMTDLEARYHDVPLEHIRQLIAPFIENKKYMHGFQHMVKN
jgi:hypothetical protein